MATKSTCDGFRTWRDKDGLSHRLHGPAIEDPDGLKQWMVHGKIHRDGGPAVEMPDGYLGYYSVGNLLRSSMPDLDFRPR